MKKLLALVLVAALYLPCYGAPLDHNILVYKFTCSFNPWMEFTDGTWSKAIVGTKKVNGYFVCDVDLYDPADPFLILDPTVFFYVKAGASKLATYFDLIRADDEMKFDIFDIDAKGNQGIYVYVDEENGYEIVGNVRCSLYGKIANVDIGFVSKVKKRIPSSLKGIFEAWADTGDNFEAFGTITASLDSKYTKNANKNGLLQADVVSQIKDDLHTQGYEYP